MSESPTIVPFVEDTKIALHPNGGSNRYEVAVGLFEFEEMVFVLHALRPSSLFVDVGANVGFYTVLAGGRRRVVPQPGAGARHVRSTPDERATERG